MLGWFVTQPIWLQVLVIGCIWGCTNPYIASSVKAQEQEKSSSQLEAQSYADRCFGFWKKLIQNPIFWIAFGINQLGSVLYLAATSQQKLEDTQVQPLCQISTILFTAIMGSLLGELRFSLKLLLGILCIALGLLLQNR